MRALLLAAGLVAFAAGPGAAPDWPVSTPAAQGMDPEPLQAFDRELAAGRHGYVDAMLVIRNGRIVYEKSYDHAKDYARLFAGKGKPDIYNYYDPGWHPFYKKTALHTMQSVTKSVTSALVGIAIARGELPGVDVKVMPYFAKYAIPPDPRRDRMTLADVLTMRTGIRWDEVTAEYTESANSCEVMEGKEDWIRYVLEQPMAEDPGKTFVYNSGASQLLSFLLEKTTGRKADDYAKEHLFGPLGIASYWKRTPTGLPDTEGGLYLEPRDLAKIGSLYLHGGVWNGRRILTKEWVAASTRPSTRTDDGSFGYGYQWWLLPPAAAGGHAAWIAWGYGGQLLIVVPELDLITVFTGWNIYDKPSLDPRTVLARVLPAVRKTP